MNKLLDITQLDDRPEGQIQLTIELELQSVKAFLWSGIRNPIDARIGILSIQGPGDLSLTFFHTNHGCY